MDSVQWGLVLVALHALTVAAAWIWVAPLFRRRGLFTFIRRLVRLDDVHRQGVHQVIAVDGYGPWTVRLEPVPTRHAIPRFPTIELHTPPAFAPGDVVAVNRNRQVEFSGTISR